MMYISFMYVLLYKLCAWLGSDIYIYIYEAAQHLSFHTVILPPGKALKDTRSIYSNQIQ